MLLEVVIQTLARSRQKREEKKGGEEARLVLICVYLVKSFMVCS